MEYYKKAVSLILPLIILALLMSSLLENRNLIFYNDSLEIQSSMSPIRANLLAFISLILVLISTLLITRMLQRRFIGQEKHHAKIVFIAVVVYIFSNYYINGLFGAEVNFSKKFIYALLIFTGLYAASHYADLRVYRNAKIGLYSILILSLLWIGIDSDAVFIPYNGIIPGLKLRFFGLTPHANAIGILGVICVLLETSYPTKQKFLRVMGYMISFIVIIIAQSKTAWTAGIISLCWMLFVQYKYSLLKLNISTREHNQKVFHILFSVVTAFFIMFFCYWQLNENIQEYSYSGGFGDLDTISGRLSIWKATLVEWSNNPIFGYGTKLWGEEYRIKSGLFSATHSHNQVIHSLGAAGIVGSIGLLFYFITLTRVAIYTVEATRGLSVGLLIVMFSGSVSEVPFDISSILSSYFFVHVLLFLTLVVGSCHKFKNIFESKSNGNYV